LVAIRKAIQRDELTPNGLLPIEGPKLLAEAVRSGLEVTDVFVRRGARTATPIPSGVKVYEIDTAVFKSIQSTESSQGIIALVRPPIFSIDRIVSVTDPLIVILAGLQDPGNVGTILRISESFLATGCIGLTGTASVYNPKTVRASAGSVFRLPYVWNLEFEELCGQLKSAGIHLVGTSPTAEQPIQQWNWHQPTALMIGNEGAGLSSEELRRCDAVLRIPHNPAVESLNSAIATAVILYEASRHERISV
jgi:TrmH family RNA methyltransferase